MSTHVISATEISRSLSDILNKVHYRGERYDIKRGKEIIAKIVPVSTKKVGLRISELNRLFKDLPQLDKKDQQSFENDIKQIRIDMKDENNPWD